MPLLLGNSVRKHKSSQSELRHGVKTPQTTTLTPNVSRRPGEKFHQAAQGMPSLEKGLVGDGLNELPNSQGYNQCGIITHTHKG
jgi:hypothetical protein